MQIIKSSTQTTNKRADVRFATACPELKTKADVRNAPPSPQTTATLSLISAASCYQANLGRERRDINADWLETRRGRGQRVYKQAQKGLRQCLQDSLRIRTAAALTPLLHGFVGLLRTI